MAAARPFPGLGRASACLSRLRSPVCERFSRLSKTELHPTTSGLRRAVGPLMTSPLIDALASCRILYQRGALREALALLEELMDEPEVCDQPYFWGLHGLFLHGMGKFDTAISSFDRASCLAPLLDDQRLARAESLLATGSDKVARQILLKLADHNSLSDSQLRRVAIGLAQVGVPLRALQVCRDAAQRETDDPDLYYTMAQLMIGLGHPPHAILSVLKVSVSLAPDELTFRIATAAHLARFGDMPGSYRVIQPVTAIQIDQLDCRRCVGFLRFVFESAGDHRLAKFCRLKAPKCGHESCTGTRNCRTHRASITPFLLPRSVGHLVARTISERRSPEQRD